LVLSDVELWRAVDRIRSLVGQVKGRDRVGVGMEWESELERKLHSRQPPCQKNLTDTGRLQNLDPA
jgi:hypothetical protein